MRKNSCWKKAAAVLMAFVLLLCIYPAKTEAKSIKLGNTLENQFLGSGTVEYNNRIYYGISRKIYSIKKDGTGKKLVFEMKDGGNGFYEMAVYGGYIYAIYDYYGGSDSSDNHLLKIKLDGTSCKNLGRVNDFAIADGKIYCTKTRRISDEYDNQYNETKGLYSMDLKGANTKKLFSGKSLSLYGTDGKTLYFGSCDWETGKTTVYTSNVKGTNKRKIKTVSGLEGVFFYKGNMYYKRSNPDDPIQCDIYKVDNNTGKTKLLYNSSGWISSFCVDNHNLYVSADEGLQKIDLNTRNIAMVNKQVTNGIRGIHGSVIIGERYRMDMKAGTDFDVLMLKLSGKIIKKIGAYFTS